MWHLAFGMRGRGDGALATNGDGRSAQALSAEQQPQAWGFWSVERAY
jgi:hypothetical protein